MPQRELPSFRQSLRKATQPLDQYFDYLLYVKK